MKTMKRIALFLAMLLALTALTACFGNNDDEGGNSALDQVQGGKQTDADDDTTPAPKETEADTTEAISEEIPTEEVTDAVTKPTYTHGSLKLPCDGTFTSKESPYLYLSAYYAVSENADGTLNVTVDVTLTGYEMYVAARYSGCTLTVGDQSVSFTTAAIRNTDPNNPTAIPFIAESFTLPADTTEIPIKVTWPFNGYYGDVYIGDVVLSDTIK